MTEPVRRYLESIHWYSDEAALRREFANRYPGVDFGFTGTEGQPPLDRHFAKQVHGTTVLEAKPDITDTTSLRRPEADGVFTSLVGRVVAVQTADCLPVLFFHPSCVMAIHAGWRGLAAGILKQAAAHFEVMNIPAKEVGVIFGPAISQSAFEVGPELADEFLSLFTGKNKLAWILNKGKVDRWHLDLAMAASLNLAELGFSASTIHCFRTCTKTAGLQWHSYRRDGAKAGRNWTWLSIQEKTRD